MDIHDLEKSTLAAPNHSSRCTSGAKIDSGHDSSTKLRSIGGKIDSSSRECVLEQPDSGHSDMLHTTKTEHVRGFDGTFHCKLCSSKFLRAHNLKSHLANHRRERRFLCPSCGKAFADEHERKHHEGLHTSGKELVCRGELSTQPAKVWGCGRHFANAAALAFHFNSLGNVGKACIIPLLDKAVKNTGVFNFPPVLLTRYPVLKDFKLVQIDAWQSAPTEGSSSSRSDSGYASYLDSSETPSISCFQVEAQTEVPQNAMSYHGSYPSLESQATASPPSQNLQDPTDFLTVFPDRPETPEGFSRGIEFLDLQIDSQGNSDSEDRSSCKVRHVSEKTSFAQEKAWDNYGNGHLLDNPSHDQSSSNSGSENENNDTSEASILDCSQRALIARLMDEICSSFFYQISHRPRQCGQGGQVSRESSSSSTEKTTTTKSFTDESQGSRRKRTQKDDEDPEDEDDGKNKRPRNQNSGDGHSTRVRYFACPFHKFDASTYSSGNVDPRVGLKYRSCGPPGWPNIGKLK